MVPAQVNPSGAINPSTTTTAPNQKQEWIQAAALVGAAIISAYSSSKTNKSAQEFASGQAGSSYQRMVADLRRAGLNPALAFQQGGAQSMNVPLHVPGEAIAAGVSSAGRLNLESKRTRSEIELNRSAANANDATAGLRNRDAQVSMEQAQKIAKEREKIEVDKDLVRSQTLQSNSAAAWNRMQTERERLSMEGTRARSRPWQFLNEMYEDATGGAGAWESIKRSLLGTRDGTIPYPMSREESAKRMKRWSYEGGE